jgi:hypothetical protein
VIRRLTIIGERGCVGIVPDTVAVVIFAVTNLDALVRQLTTAVFAIVGIVIEVPAAVRTGGPMTLQHDHRFVGIVSGGCGDYNFCLEVPFRGRSECHLEKITIVIIWSQAIGPGEGGVVE